MKTRKKLIRWIKAHKKQLVIAGISIGALILAVLAIKNRKAIDAVWRSLRTVVKHEAPKLSAEVTQVTSEAPTKTVEILSSIASQTERTPFEVRRHVRNLPDGQHASLKKISEAMNNDICLKDGQTWVERYMKGGAAA